MFFIQDQKEIEDANKTLKSLFQQLDYVSAEEQYDVLLNISRILLQTHEDAEAKSYLLQAALIQETFEAYYILATLSLSKNDISDAQNFIEKIKSLSLREFHIFSWEDVRSLIEVEDLTYESRDLYQRLNSLTQPQHDGDTNIQLDQLVQDMGEKAAPVLLSIKDKSGLAKKYPQLDQLSIKQWEAEFPHRKEKIQQMELLIEQQTPLRKEELIDLGRMYLLENEFLKAAECFIQAKNVFLSTR